MKKRHLLKLVCCTLLLACLLTMTVSVSAKTVSVEPCSADAGEPMPCVEETEWMFRIWNGELQKRLWSNTYGRWLTGWIKA